MRQKAEEIFEEYQFPYPYIDANGWSVTDSVFSKEVFLQTPEKEHTTCYVFTIEFYRDTDKIKKIQLLIKE